MATQTAAHVAKPKKKKPNPIYAPKTKPVVPLAARSETPLNAALAKIVRKALDELKMPNSVPSDVILGALKTAIEEDRKQRK